MVRRLLIEVLVTFALIVVKEFWFKTTNPGKLFEAMTYSLVQARLTDVIADRNPPIVIVDISKLDETQVPGKLSPRSQLTKLLDDIIGQDPAVIGIDLDFSTDEDGNWPPRSGPQLFDYALGHQSQTPIFLGANRSRYQKKAEDWFGSVDYEDMASVRV